MSVNAHLQHGTGQFYEHGRGKSEKIRRLPNEWGFPFQPLGLFAKADFSRKVGRQSYQISSSRLCSGSRGMGSHTGHTAVAIWEHEQLYVAESTINSSYWCFRHGLL